MTLAELMQYLDEHSDYAILDGDPAQTLARARAGDHRDALAGEILGAIAEHCGCDDTDAVLERSEVVAALGPLRLRYMRDDAPVAGFRMVERSIQLVDGAFNEEALRNRSR